MVEVDVEELDVEELDVDEDEELDVELDGEEEGVWEVAVDDVDDVRRCGARGRSRRPCLGGCCDPRCHRDSRNQCGHTDHRPRVAAYQRSDSHELPL